MLGGVVPAGGPVVAEIVSICSSGCGSGGAENALCATGSFKTNYRLRRHMGHPQGVQVPLLILSQVSGILQNAKAA